MNSSLGLTLIVTFNLLSLSARSFADDFVGSVTPDVVLARLNDGNAGFAASRISATEPTPNA